MIHEKRLSEITVQMRVMQQQIDFTGGAGAKPSEKAKRRGMTAYATPEAVSPLDMSHAPPPLPQTWPT